MQWNLFTLIIFHFRSCDTSDDSEIPETPITNVTRRIEEISICIMQEIPNLLDNGRSELLTPLEIEEKISYELFSSVAKSVIENKVFRLTRSVWSKVAVIFHLVKEVVFSGLLSEVEVALLVDYASRFVAENEFDDIESQGGWVCRPIRFSRGFIRGAVVMACPNV